MVHGQERTSSQLTFLARRVELYWEVIPHDWTVNPGCREMLGSPILAK